jgi:hypothetical protein
MMRSGSEWLADSLPPTHSKETSMGDEQEREDAQELPLLAGIAAFLRWLEELVVLASGPLLMVGLGIGLVALLSDGALLVRAPWLVYAWAISQTVGVDGQLVGAWYRVSVAVGRRRASAAIAYMVLGLLLAYVAYVAYVAALVFATQQAYHLTTALALARLGMNTTSWLWQRSGVPVLLVCLSGYLRYRAPRKPTKSLEERKQRLRERLELDALKAELRAQQAQSAISVLRGALQAAHGPNQMETRLAKGISEPMPMMVAQHQGEDHSEEVSAESATPLSPSAPLPMAWPRMSGGSVETSSNGHNRYSGSP